MARGSRRNGPDRVVASSSAASYRSVAWCARCRPAAYGSSHTAGGGGCTRILKIERPKSDDERVARASRYTLKGDPHSSHSVILDWLGEGRAPPLPRVGAADGPLSRLLTRPPPNAT